LKRPVNAQESNENSVSGGTAAVLVGQETFHVHQNVLVSSSKFFQNAMKPVWRTEPLKPVDLSDVDPETFKVYSQWLYTKQMTGKLSHLSLAKSYVLGERIMDETFQRTVVLAMINRFNRAFHPGLSSIRTIYASTPPGLAARRLMVDFCAFRSVPSSRRIKMLDANNDGEFMVDLIAALAKYRTTPTVPPPWKDESLASYFNDAEQDDNAENRVSSNDTMTITDQ
tara:strand:- start:18259 stop:18936 length:678 start_codon:yes stop_codon:yes gene_type:complete